MSRKYVKIDERGKEILELKREGKTSQEIVQKSLEWTENASKAGYFSSIGSRGSWR